MHPLSTHYTEFLTEIKSRFEEAKVEWKERLEEVTNRIHSHGNTTGPFFLLPMHQYLAPFRSLLQLYAHEDVFTNHALDRAFAGHSYGSSGDGDGHNVALTFYAPQLLCFLLHNSYLNTGQLESWVLDKCRQSVQFSHRCFWFLRAWYLQGTQQSGMYSSNNSNTALDDYNPDDKKSSHGSLMSLVGGRKSRSNSGGSLSSMMITSKNQTGGRRPNTEDEEDGNIIRIPSEPQMMLMMDGSEEQYKYSVEERKSLENLLAKVMEAGEIAARKLEFGDAAYSKSSSNSLGSMNKAPLEEEDTVEINPLSYGTDALYSIGKNSIFPSMKHLNAATTEDVHGFISKRTAEKKSQENISTSDTSYFFRTPDFLDSLMDIADALLHEPRSNRTVELRRKLEELEVNMLPANSIYIPIQNSMHRVWRIVASDSIALSTKERVPCIVYLEVIGCESEQKKELGRNNPFKSHVPVSRSISGGSNEQVLERWYKSPRPPQRLNSILSKVSNYTQKGLRKLRDDFEISTHQHHHHYTKVSSMDEENMSTNAGQTHIFSLSNIPNGINESMEMGAMRQSSSGTMSKMDRKSSNEELRKAYPISRNIKPPLKPKSRIQESEMMDQSYSVPSSRGNSRPPTPSRKLGQWLIPSQPEETNEYSFGRESRVESKLHPPTLEDKLASLNYVDSEGVIDDDNMSSSTNGSVIKRRVKLNTEDEQTKKISVDQKQSLEEKSIISTATPNTTTM